MKILLANKFYYRRGGDCIYMLNLEQMFKEKGHDVAVFSMQYPENLDTPWSKYFPCEVKFKPGLGMIETLLRPFGWGEVGRKFRHLLSDFKPDVVHLNNIHTQLSPVIAEIAHKRGIKVVWTLHDYKLLCPRYDCLQNDLTVCEECFTNKNKVLEHRCMKNSRIASIIAYKEATTWNTKRLEACTNVFVCPSSFMAEKMKQGGFDTSKLKVLCNFIDTTKCHRNDGYTKDEYYCFIGRLSHEKGADTLIDAANRLKFKLVVVGDGPLRGELEKKAADNISFVGFKQWNEIKCIVGKARFTVIPSEWYENNPLSVIEAQCLGTPVLGARIGGIPELINEGVSGMTFESRNADDLAIKITDMMNHHFDYESLATTSWQRYSAEKYYKEIMSVYRSEL